MGFLLLPAPNLFHEYLIDAGGKELATEGGPSMCQGLSVILNFHAAYTWPLNLLRFYLILACIYGGYFSLVFWQKWNSLGIQSLHKGAYHSFGNSISWLAYYLSSLIGSWKVMILWIIWLFSYCQVVVVFSWLSKSSAVTNFHETFGCVCACVSVSVCLLSLNVKCIS